jgi:glucose/arabinose dehydrogenase
LLTGAFLVLSWGKRGDAVSKTTLPKKPGEPELKRALLGVSLAALVAIPAVAAIAAEYTGRPPGVEAQQSRNSQGYPAPRMIEGQPVETRAPELASDKPAFPGQTRAPYKATAPFDVTTVTSELKQPWALQFLSGGRMLVTEKPGTLRIVSADGKLSDPVKGVPAVNFGGQVGLLDVALDKNYARNKRIFFSYSELVGTDESNIVLASANLDEGGLALSNVKVLFKVTPLLPKSLVANEGGRIAIDPKDGSVFMICGDRSRSPPWLMAQKLDNTLGKMIHLTVDGKPHPSNPYLHTKGAMPEIWSIGHRSEEGLAFDNQGRLWEIEHGPRGGDELNLIKRGLNYGWPVVSHGIDYPGFPVGDGSPSKPGMEEPRYYWDPVIGPSGLAFYKGNLFPQWKNSVFVGGLRATQLVRLELKGDKVVAEEPLMYDLKNRVRDVRVGPEGAVYVLTDNGLLLKLTPKKA